ncbi:MAG: hypothetical protein IJ060_01005 [Oscillospiraceae bacterium]|nr:hypothetical protein [Oscillospiraceae bacterium]
MNRRIFWMRSAACCLAAAAAAASLPASAAESEPMTFRIDAERHYVLQSELAEGDLVIPGGLYIDNYSGITEMALQLKSDAPLHIENGDFTRDDSRTEYAGTDPVTKEKLYRPKPCFFTDYAEGRYTQHSDETGEENAVLWCSSGWMSGKPGELYRPESSFLSFDIRIPADTPAGVYTCFLSTEQHVIAQTLIQRDFYVYNGSETVTDSVALKALTLTVEPAPLYGDVNCDGVISVEDAQITLGCYTAQIAQKSLTDEALTELFETPYIHTAAEAADVSRSNGITVEDAQGILQYYTALIAHKTPQWSDIFE